MKNHIEEATESIVVAAQMSEKYYHKPLIVTYSGGKDSDVILNLAKNCLKPNQFEVIHSITTVDAPQTNRHVNEVFRRCADAGINTIKAIPYYKGEKTNLWKLIEDKTLPPTRFMRYCCQILKEQSTPNRIILTGVREKESIRRRGRDIFRVIGKTKTEALNFGLDHVKEVFSESLQSAKRQGIKEDTPDVWDCKLIESAKKHKLLTCNPIYKWSDTDVWRYIEKEKITVNPLYSMGYTRVGCVGCPMAGYKELIKEFNDFPTYKANYIKAFEKMIEVRKKRGLETTWKTGQEAFDWWIGKDKHVCRGQMELSDFFKM